VNLIYNLADFEDDESTGDEVEWEDCEIEIAATQLGDGLLRIDEPTSLSPFGPYAEMLNLVDLVQAEHVEGNLWRYRKTASTARIWTRSFAIGERGRNPDGWLAAIRRDRPAKLIEQLQQLKACWEAAVGNLTIQGYLADHESEPSVAIQALIDELHQILGRSV